MEEWDDLTPAKINSIAIDADEGTADIDDARLLLEYFCVLEERKKPIPPLLLSHLRRAFRSYLNGDFSIERALGLKRQGNRPKDDPERSIQIALAILKLRLGGMPHQDAVASVAEDFHKGETAVSDAWREHMQDAIIRLRMERSLDSFPWTESEIERLTEIFGKYDWFLTSGKPRTYPK